MNSHQRRKRYFYVDFLCDDGEKLEVFCESIDIIADADSGVMGFSVQALFNYKYQQTEAMEFFDSAKDKCTKLTVVADDRCICGDFFLKSMEWSPNYWGRLKVDFCKARYHAGRVND